MKNLFSILDIDDDNYIEIEDLKMFIKNMLFFKPNFEQDVTINSCIINYNYTNSLISEIMKIFGNERINFSKFSDIIINKNSDLYLIFLNYISMMLVGIQIIFKEISLNSVTFEDSKKLKDEKIFLIVYEPLILSNCLNNFKFEQCYEKFNENSGYFYNQEEDYLIKNKEFN